MAKQKHLSAGNLAEMTPGDSSQIAKIAYFQRLATSKLQRTSITSPGMGNHRTFSSKEAAALIFCQYIAQLGISAGKHRSIFDQILKLTDQEARRFIWGGILYLTFEREWRITTEPKIHAPHITIHRDRIFAGLRKATEGAHD